MAKLSEIPDASVDWNNIRYNTRSDGLRPRPGFRYCKKCNTPLAVNQFNYYRNKNNPDGYSYVCIKCMQRH